MSTTKTKSKLGNFLAVSFLFLLFALLDSVLAYWILNDNFPIGFNAWWGISVVGVGIVRSGVIIQDVVEELTGRR